MTALHLLFLFIALPSVLYADFLGLQWIRGTQATLERTTMHRLHIVVYVALAGLILTGLLLFSERSTRLLANSAFIMKMVFVAVLVVNSVFIGVHMHKALSSPFATLTRSERVRILASGVVSTLGWIGAIIGGLMIG